jgi:hypothetical protein
VSAKNSKRLIPNFFRQRRSLLTGRAASAEMHRKRTQPSSANRESRIPRATVSGDTSTAAKRPGLRRGQTARRRCRWPHGKPGARLATGCAGRFSPPAKSSVASACSRHDSITSGALSPPGSAYFPAGLACLPRQPARPEVQVTVRFRGTI